MYAKWEATPQAALWGIAGNLVNGDRERDVGKKRNRHRDTKGVNTPTVAMLWN